MRELVIAFTTIEINYTVYDEKEITVANNKTLHSFVENKDYKTLHTAEIGELEKEIDIYIHRIIRHYPDIAKYLVVSVYVPIAQRTQPISHHTSFAPVIQLEKEICINEYI